MLNQMMVLHFTLTWTMSLLVLLLLIDSGTALCLIPVYELKHSIQDTTTGAVKLQCQEETRSSLKLLNVTESDVVFWLNRGNATDAGLRERDDVTVIETEDQLGIVFNLTRDLEGYYTCGRRIHSRYVYESPTVILICKPLSVYTTIVPVLVLSQCYTNIVHCINWPNNNWQLIKGSYLYRRCLYQTSPLHLVTMFHSTALLHQVNLDSTTQCDGRKALKLLLH